MAFDTAFDRAKPGAGLRPISAIGLTGLLLLSLALEGCATNEMPTDPIERAKLATQLEKEANREFDRYVTSQNLPEGVDSAALRRYVELRKKITQLLGPQDSPRAYADFGAALRRLGLDQESLAQALARELESTSDADERASLEKRIQEQVAASKDSYRRSNAQFETYFRVSDAMGSLVNPDAYKWALLNAEAIEDWRAALAYLEQYASSVTLTEEGKANARERSLFYKERLRIQEEQQLERELGLPATASSR